MDTKSNFSGMPQLPMFDIAEKSTGIVELFPELWGSAEALSSPNSHARLEAIERLSELDAARLSPLVTYLLATRLDDPDICCRSKVVSILGEILRVDQHGQIIPDEVRQRLINFLTFAGTKEILSILEALDQDGGLEIQVVRLLKICSSADKLLVEILSNRANPVSIRQWSVRLIGKIGYTEAIGELERMLGRLEMRVAGQQSMPFAPTTDGSELLLIPDIQQALAMLRMP